MFRSGLEASWRGQNYFWRPWSPYLAWLCAEHSFSVMAETQKTSAEPKWLSNICTNTARARAGGHDNTQQSLHTWENRAWEEEGRLKEEDVASVPHRSFDETTTNCSDSQCKVMQTRWGPEHSQERQGCLEKIIWGYRIIHLYIHSSLEWTLCLGSPLVSHWDGMLWSDCLFGCLPPHMVNC